jgi:hypothetical protein
MGSATGNFSARPRSVARERSGELTGPATVSVSLRPCSVIRERSGVLTGPATGTVSLRTCFMAKEVQRTDSICHRYCLFETIFHGEGSPEDWRYLPLSMRDHYSWLRRPGGLAGLPQLRSLREHTLWRVRELLGPATVTVSERTFSMRTFSMAREWSG